MAYIPTLTDQVPVFNDYYVQCIGTPNSFEAVSFYSDFMRLMNQRELTIDVKQSIIDFFQILFIPDPKIDVLCAEAFQPTPQ